MRENMGLYRGKRKDNGEWAEGNLFENDNSNFPMVLIGHVIMSRDKHFPQDLSFDGYGLEEVDPETVGQFTGLTDNNGEKIFEGDIIHYQKSDIVCVGIIRFGEYSLPGLHLGFNVEWVSPDAVDFRKDIRFWAICREISVVGNIHDNPELIEVRI